MKMDVKLNVILLMDNMYIDTFHDVDNITVSEDGSIYSISADGHEYIFKVTDGFKVYPFYDIPEFTFSCKRKKAIDSAVDQLMEELYATSNLS